MGVVHKLKPEVLSFIIENKKNNPSLSCRSLTLLISEKLKIKVSKSSINAIFKENDLSMPIGRRRTKKKRKFNMPSLPVIEGTTAITLVSGQDEPIREQLIKPPEVEKELALEEKRIKEAQEQARKLQEEEKIVQELARAKALEEDRLRDLERLAQEAAENKRREEEVRKLAEEKAAQELERIRVLEEAKLRDQEKQAQEAAENKSKQEEAGKLEEEKKIREAELNAEKEKWVRLSEEEQKSKQPVNRQEAVPSRIEPVVSEAPPEDRFSSGVILLKALDCLIGGCKEINAAISREIGSNPDDFLSLTEELIFKSLSGAEYTRESNKYYEKIRQSGDIRSEIVKIIADTFVEARGVKINFSDGDPIYIDGQFHSSWPTPRIPYDFASTVNDLKNNLNKYFFLEQKIILFSAPGYDIFPKDFFSLLLNILQDNQPSSLTLFRNTLEEFKEISLNPGNKFSLVFGLWPWQFTGSRKVRKIGDFSLRHVDGIDRDLYLGEIEINLLQPSLNQGLTLKGCAIKTDLKEKIRLVVLNTDLRELSLEKLAALYLKHWPNFEEAFQDFSRKIELFSYSGNEQKFLSGDQFEIYAQGSGLEIEEVFSKYIEMLDLYLRWHFLPPGYAEKDLNFTRECFYGLPVKLIASQDKVRVKVLFGQDYQFQKDLEYLICRLNERQIKSANGQLFWFESAFK
ncbi:MAG: cell envelope integrity protein TolA [Candidatus Omnitrophota bacterium]|jgi:hypothetical protein